MRVGILTPRLLERPTGTVVYTRELLCALRELEEPPEIVVLNRSTSVRRPDWFGGFQVANIGGESGRLWAPLPVRIARAARHWEVDIVHASGNVAPFLPEKSDRFKRVVTVHDVGPMVYPADRRPKERLAYAALMPALRWTTDTAIADSEASARDIVRYAAMPPGMITVTAPYFLAVGDVAIHKNLDGVVEAFRIVARTNPAVRLVVSGQLRFGGHELRGRAGDLGDRVDFAGYVSDSRLEELYREAVGLVAPSLYEGFGLIVLEAMAGGVPVITPKCSSLPEVAGEAALLVDPRRPDDIAAAMARLLDEPSLVENIQIKGFEQAQQFSWRRTALDTMGVYRAVLIGKEPEEADWRTETPKWRSLAATWLAAGVAATVAGKRSNEP